MTRDSQLQEAVLAEFQWEPSITAAHIGVTAKDGVVTLTGHVPSYIEKSAAERAAARVHGVRGVAQEIVVELPVQTRRSDEDIARAALDRIAWEASLPDDAIRVKVEGGWVTLSGEVGWNYERFNAEQVVHGLHGVVGVTNQVTIRPTVNVGEIDRDIGRALDRSWLDASTIRVSAVNGKVTLQGTVHTPAEKRIAATTAWGARGTTDVENDLVVAD